MRSRKFFVVLGTLILLGGVVAEGSPLQEKTQEWAFEATFEDTDDVGTFWSYAIDWGWIFANGQHELGVTLSQFDFDFDVGVDADGIAIGPTYQWNWRPEAEKATGFVLANISSIGGDEGDVFDSSYTVGVGIKSFVGNSAAIKAFLAFDQFQGADGFDDVDQTRLGVGISIFTHGRM